MTGKPRAGVLLIGSPRFRELGAGSEKAGYEQMIRNYSEELVGELSRTVEPVFNGIVYDREDVGKAVSFFHAGKVHCVVCVFLSWSEDKAWVTFLRDMYDVPLILHVPAHPPAPYKNTRDEADFIGFLSRCGLVGSLEGSGSIRRLDRSVEIAAGDFESVRKRVSAFAFASMAKAALRGSKFGLLGNYNELMWSTYIDPYNIFARIGPELNFISCQSLKEEIDSTCDKAAQEYMEELARFYHVEADVDEHLFRESARASIALASLREKLDIDALILNDVNHELFRTIGLRPGFYHPSFHENGGVLVPEGDLGAGTIMYALKQITGRNICFVEPFYINSEENTFSAGHGGPQDYNDERFRELVRIARDIRFAKTSFKYAGAPFGWYRMPPGLKTLAHFSECNGRYKIVCFTAESLPGEHSLCSYSHGDFKPETNVAGLFEKIIKTGVTQHFAVVEGDVREELSVFARINDFEFYKF